MARALHHAGLSPTSPTREALAQGLPAPEEHMTISSIGAQSDDWASQIQQSFQRRDKDQGDDLAEKLMGDLDKDGTSTLSLEESGLSQSVFSTADTDGDGQISAQELADALEQERSQMMAGSTTQGASLLGTLLSQAGVSMPQMGMGHMPPPPDDSKMAGDIISKLDQDGDSALSLKESGLSEDMFNSVDTDGDGVVSSEELANALKSEREQMQASGANGSGGTGATASNAGSESLFKTLMDNAGLSPMGPPPDQMGQMGQSGQVGQMSSAQLRKALQAYGSNLLSTILGQYDGLSGLSYEDSMSSGQMSLLNYIGTQSVDYTV
jgi:hypothetical protein